MPKIAIPFPITCSACQSNLTNLVEEYEYSNHPLRFDGFGESYFQCGSCNHTWTHSEELEEAFTLVLQQIKADSD